MVPKDAVASRICFTLLCCAVLLHRLPDSKWERERERIIEEHNAGDPVQVTVSRQVFIDSARIHPESPSQLLIRLR